MPDLLDLHLVPYAHYAGKEIPGLQSVLTAEPPRRPARGRDKDRLILYFVMQGDAILPPAKQTQLLETLAGIYYKVPGSVTTGIRTVSEELNKFLLERNKRLASRGQRAVGLMAILVLRSQQIYLGLCGPIHAFSISAQSVEHFYNPDFSDQALGVSRVTPVEYHQLTVEKDDSLVLAAEPSPEWDRDFLSTLYGLGPGSLRRRLFTQENINLNALLIQAKPGQGKIYLPGTGPAVVEETTSRQAKPSKADVASAVVSIAAADETETSISDSEIADQVEPVKSQGNVLSPDTDAGTSSTILSADEDDPAGKPLPFEHLQDEGSHALDQSNAIESTQSVSVSVDGETSLQTEKARAKKHVSKEPSQTRQAIAVFGGAVTGGLVRGMQKIGSFFHSFLPEDLFASIPSPLMAAIAIFIPVLIVGVATVAYIRLGSAAMYQEYYIQAKTLAQEAAQETDILQQRSDWDEVLQLVAQAEAIYSNPETQSLRDQAQGAIDKIELIKRIDYQPALFKGLPYDVNISKMIISNDDLYLLDSKSGSVIRAASTNTGYEIDSTFQCGPGVSGSNLEGPLIDLVPWPQGYQPKAAILAMDGNGNVLYCDPEEQPVAGKMTPQENRTIGETQLLSISSGNLYVLEPTGNAIWIYQQGNLDAEPFLFFIEEVPKLDDIADMTVHNGEELYLLHQDGTITYCFYSGMTVSPTHCTDTPPVDNRPGREGQPFEPPTPFTQILNTQPPDPSLFMLEGARKAVYHFSLRNMNYQFQYLPLIPLAPGNATAFAVDMFRRTIYLAVGNQLYLGFVP